MIIIGIAVVQFFFCAYWVLVLKLRFLESEVVFVRVKGKFL